MTNCTSLWQLLQVFSHFTQASQNIQASKDTKIKYDIVLYVLKIPCIHFIEFVAELLTVHENIIAGIISVDKNQFRSLNLVSGKLK